MDGTANNKYSRDRDNYANGYNSPMVKESRTRKNQYYDVNFHRDHGNINAGGPPVQTRSHTKYGGVQPNNSDTVQNSYHGHQQQGYRHDSSWRGESSNDWHATGTMYNLAKKKKKKKIVQILMDRDNENIGRATPSQYLRNASRASRMDYEPYEEEVPDGQVSAREPLQNRDAYISKDVDNREKTQFAKQTMALRKMTQTPVDKGTRLQPIQKLYGQRAGSQAGHYLNAAEAMWPSYQPHGKPDPDPKQLGSVSGTDVRGGWMSRPQSVLGEDGDMYVHTPRDMELKPVKSGKSRGYPSRN